MKTKVTDIAASVHARLLNRAKAEGRTFEELLQYYVMERFLYRLSRSDHADRFVLKGALMLQFWGGPLSRATKDIDLLGRSTATVDELVDVVHAGGEGVNHHIWFDDVTVRQEAPRAGVRPGMRSSYGTIKANGHSGSEAYDMIPAFLEDLADLELTGLMRTFYAPSAPEGNINDSQEDLIPAVNWSFPLTLELRAPEERAAIKTLLPEGQ